MTAGPRLPGCIIVATLVATSFMVPVAVAELVANADVAASTVRFKLGATLHTVEGTGHLIRGRVSMHADGGARGEIVVDAKSFDTANDKRDKKMHAKVLESERFSVIVLQVTSIDGDVPRSGEGDIEIEGELTLHGNRHPIRTPVHITVDGDSFTATAVMTVPYVAWGLHDPSSFFLRVDKEVEVQVDVAGRLSRRTPELP